MKVFFARWCKQLWDLDFVGRWLSMRGDLLFCSYTLLVRYTVCLTTAVLNGWSPDIHMGSGRCAIPIHSKDDIVYYTWDQEGVQYIYIQKMTLFITHESKWYFNTGACTAMILKFLCSALICGPLNRANV